jgi:hypothetical protein
MAVGAATFAIPTLFKNHQFGWNWRGFLSARGGGARIVGIAEVSWAASSCTYAAESPTSDEYLKLKRAQ